MHYETTPICPIPGLGHCVRERGNFLDEAKEGCTGDCYDATYQGSGAAAHPNRGCIIGCYEDLD